MSNLIRFGWVSAVFAASLAAQSTATITGRVVDPSGAAVAGARIEAVNDATNFRREAASSTTGNFALERFDVVDSRSGRLEAG